MVSILVFLEPLLRPIGLISDNQSIGFVSILVFLEPLLRLLIYSPASPAPRVSILVFLEPLLRRKIGRDKIGV